MVTGPLDQARTAFAAGHLHGAVRLLGMALDLYGAREDERRLRDVLELAGEIRWHASGTLAIRCGDIEDGARACLAALSAHRGSPPGVGIIERLDDLQLRFTALERELRELRATAEEPAAAPALQLHEAEASVPEPEVVEGPPMPVTPRPETEVHVSRGPRRRTQSVTLADLLGARTLAWAGAFVTLLGVAFLFVLAIGRGWIGPELRVVIGASISAGLFAAGWWAHRRFGQLYAVMGAVAAAIGGAYATIAASAALYGFLPAWAALLAAAVVAAAGVLTSLVWSTRAFAALALLGAMAMPAFVDDGRFTITGGWFVAILLAASCTTAVVRGWRILLGLGASFAALQTISFVLEGEGSHGALLTLASVDAVLLLVAGVAWQFRHGGERLERPTISLALGSFGLVVLAVQQLLGADQAFGLLAVAATYGIAAALLFHRRCELSLLVSALGLASAATAVGLLLGGDSRTLVWACEAVLLAWLARSTREARFLLGSLVFLGLAVVGALAGAPPSALFVPSSAPAAGAPGVVYAALACALVAALCRAPGLTEEASGGFVAALVTRTARLLAGNVRRVRVAALATASVLAVHAASLGLLALFQVTSESVDSGFEHGHVGLAGFWTTISLGAVFLGRRLGLTELRVGGHAVLAFAVAVGLGHDLAVLPAALFGWSLLVVGTAALGAAFLESVAIERRLAASVLTFLGAVLLVPAVSVLLHGDPLGISLEGAGLLGLALVYGGLAAVLIRRRRDRDLATLHWAIALCLGVTASAELLSGMLFSLVVPAGAVALAYLANRTGEERFRLGSIAYLLVALCRVLALEAPFTDLFTASRHPAGGVPSVVFVVLAMAAFAHVCPWTRGRLVALWSSATWLVYALSLSVLELFEQVTGGSVADRFQRGHVGVSALWGLVGLALLYAGLSRRERALRLGGFALFGASLGKLFLYDLATLSSITRALSFLAVGTLLLVAGFAYQRLTEHGGSGARRRRTRDSAC